ncbi:MAG: CHAD domain-containing protein [Rhodobacter sp.]|nr:CHAD domain-containing protein [Rhodobacter sp.]
MAYRFSPDDPSLQQALRRIADEELRAALAVLDDTRLPPQAVHDVRKRAKKLRGLLRLLQGSFPDHARENAALRDAGRLLALRRDAEVRLATLDWLFPDTPQALMPLRRLLEQDRDAPPAPSHHAEAVEILRALHSRVCGWTLTGKDHRILVKGLARTRRRAAQAMEDAARSPGFDAIHDWRKRAKDFWYQTRLLAPIWPEMMVPLTKSAEGLTEALGVHHDIAVLQGHLPPGLLDSAAEALFHRKAIAAQQEIEAHVFAEGRRLFAGDPEAMAQLWGRWWLLWRDQAASAPDSPRSISATVSPTP